MTIGEAPAPDDLLNLRVHLVNLWHGRTTLVLLAVLLGLAGGASSFVGKRQYEATATLSVNASIVGEQPAAPLEALKFVPMVASQNVASQTVGEFKLNEAPYNLSPQTLLEEVVTVRSDPNSNLMRVMVRLDKPDLAASVANGFSELGIAYVRKVNPSEVGTVEGELKPMLDQAAALVRTAESAYDNYRRTAQIELMKKEVETLLEQRARQAAGGLKNEAFAPLSQLYEREATLDRLDVERQLARKAYEGVAAKYQGAKLAALGRTPYIQVIDPAVLGSPIPRYVTRNAMLGVALGLLAGCIIVFGREALGKTPTDI